MANSFIKSPYVEINNQITQLGNVAVDTQSLLICSRRGNPNDSGMDLDPLTIDLYRPYKIPQNFTVDGPTALNWARNQGATVVLGVSGTINLVAPTSVTVTGGLVTLSWSSEPYGFADLLGGNVVGTVSQAVSSSSGTIYSVSQSGVAPFVIILTGVTGDFNTTNVLAIDYENTSIPIPDGRKTEQWVLDLYYACQGQNLQSTQNLTFSSPPITLSLVSDRDDNFNPIATPVTIATPDTTTVNPDGTVLLAWDAAPTNWIYVPQQNLGTSTITQATSLAVGTIIQQLGGAYSDTGDGVSLLLGDVTGTFNTTNTLSLVLDDTVTTFSLLGNVWYKFVLGSTEAELTTDDDLNGAGLLFLQYINSVNTAQATIVGQYFTEGILGQISTSQYDFIGNAQPNDANILYVFYPYFNRLNDPFLLPSSPAAFGAGAFAANTSPYNSIFNRPWVGLPVSSDSTTYIQTGINGPAEAILQYGYTPISVDINTGVAFAVNISTTQTTIDGQDNVEFYDLHTQQVRGEISYRLAIAVSQPQFQNVGITNKILSDLHGAVLSTLKKAESDNLIFNVNALQQYIVVERSTVNPHQVNISCKIQIDPELTGIVVDVNVISASITVPTTQA